MNSNQTLIALPDTELRVIHSTHIGEDYHLFIHLPRAYGQTQDRFPVLYLLDGDQFFAMVTDIVKLLRHRKGLAEFIVVGIGYGTDVSEHFNQRMRDLLPSNVEELPSSGGAEEFLKLITDEVIPFVEFTYRIDREKQTIMGASAGGLFALYTLFQAPNIFHNYIVSSPPLDYDDRILFQHEETFAANHDELIAKLFLSVGGVEDAESMVSPLHEFHDLIASRNYAGLETTVVVIDDENHFSVQPAAFVKGLKTIFGGNGSD
ncbi:prolyl oligopeptidase family serine peptidase [Chloroflexi bacterium TSY]|nr:prolyl oligopeptidase family serine peptidase [Chloroflexi bacterium TSY]